MPRCGSLASSGLPLAVSVPSTTQLFEPSASSRPPPSSCCRTASWPPSARANAFDQLSPFAALVPGSCSGLGRPLAGCVRLFNGRLVEDAQSVLRIRRHQFGSPLRPDAGEQITTQELVRVVRAEIPGHHLDPHQHVGPGPRRRLEAQQRELRRQRRIGGEKRIHAGDSTPRSDGGHRRAAVPRRSAPRVRTRPSAGTGPAERSRRRRLPTASRARFAAGTPSATAGPAHGRSRDRRTRPAWPTRRCAGWRRRRARSPPAQRVLRREWCRSSAAATAGRRDTPPRPPLLR